jgi:hypothetical protein
VDLPMTCTRTVYHCAKLLAQSADSAEVFTQGRRQ